MRTLFYGWLGVFLFLDLWTKGWMEKHLSLGETCHVIKGFAVMETDSQRLTIVPNQFDYRFRYFIVA